MYNVQKKMHSVLFSPRNAEVFAAFCRKRWKVVFGKWYKGGKWAQLDLNRRPADYESAALTN